jgi:hypothetical protein
MEAGHVIDIAGSDPASHYPGTGYTLSFREFLRQKMTDPAIGKYEGTNGVRKTAVGRENRGLTPEGFSYNDTRGGCLRHPFRIIITRVPGFFDPSVMCNTRWLEHVPCRSWAPGDVDFVREVDGGD